jgi:hypothetical protein
LKEVEGWGEMEVGVADHAGLLVPKVGVKLFTGSEFFAREWW